ncbi:predicted protein [Streptomyces viridosporus ATCC 14672]|uniref:Predicted protein n=1 Tax=Streptomyces viridosporus (strain ATCC 14672 / DSM 40746 / JCM 4963 / KCTC 9882 / NRRL B-12104 / FH 1290) TaxID=566461 RepID=D6A288_STRV1|nr:predicted protein [Streptomyces viridosporus ATCC 14672]
MGRYTPSCPTATPGGKPIWFGAPDLGFHGRRLHVACHCRLPSSALGRPRTAQRRPSSDRDQGRLDLVVPLTADRNLVDDFAERGGHHDVRSLYGPPLVAVVRPPDVGDKRALLDAQE